MTLLRKFVASASAITIFLLAHASMAEAPVIRLPAVINYADGIITVTYSAGESASLITANYKNGVLENIDINKITIEADGENKIAKELSEGDKIFLWSSVGSMRPLANEYIITNDAPPEEEITYLYKLDHENKENYIQAWSPREASALKLVEGDPEYGSYIWYDFTDNYMSSRAAEYSFEAVTEELNYYTTEFDAALAAGDDMETCIAVKTAAFAYKYDSPNFGPESGYLFKLSTDKKSDVWTLQEADSVTVKLSAGEWYHYKLVVDKEDSLVYVSITDSEGELVVDGTMVSINGADKDIAGVYILAGRGGASIKFDNLTVQACIADEIA